MTSSFPPRFAPAATRARANTWTARAALAYRIEGARIGQPYQVGTAAADAFASGIAEGHAIWRGARGQPVTTDGAYVGRLRIIGQLAGDIEAQAGDIEILLAALFDKLDALTELAPAAADERQRM